jgi:hypothetical protein
VVAHRYGLGQDFEVEGVLIGTGAEEGPAASRSQYQVVVREVIAVGADVSVLEVYPFDLGLEELYPQGAEYAPERVGGVAHLDVAGDGRRDHRLEGCVVVLV